MLLDYNSLAYLTRICSQILIVGTISSASVLCGLIPQISANFASISFSSAASAQDISESDVTAFAQIVWEFEPTRRDVMAKIQGIMGKKDIPDIICGVKETITSLPAEAKTLAEQLCNKYEATIKKYKMTNDRFQEIATLVSKDATLKKRIDQKLIDIQK